MVVQLYKQSSLHSLCILKSKLKIHFNRFRYFALTSTRRYYAVHPENENWKKTFTLTSANQTNNTQVNTFRFQVRFSDSDRPYNTINFDWNYFFSFCLLALAEHRQYCLLWSNLTMFTRFLLFFSFCMSHKRFLLLTFFVSVFVLSNRKKYFALNCDKMCCSYYAQHIFKHFLSKTQWAW